MTTPPIVRPDPAPFASGKALDHAEFARLMAPAGPFEGAPHLALAVSGGVDSMALCLLSDAWARRRKGRVTALTVDHHLRPESGAEARQAGQWLRQRGIAHHILRWRGRKPETGVQAAARAARFDLLARWCVRNHVLHLLCGHQMEDQAETLLLRLVAGSGADGLAAMPLVQDLAAPRDGSVRLVRPLLSVPRARLRATLEGKSQAWIDDPSNRNPAYARARLAGALGALGGEGMAPSRLARTARRAGRDRAALDSACGELMALCAAPHPAGFVRLDWTAWRDSPEAISLRVLARLLAAVGARPFGPRLERLERLWDEMRGGYPRRAATLGGCRVVPYRGTLLICREPARARDIAALKPGASVLWDRRFRVSLGRRVEFRGACTVGRLGADGISGLRGLLADGGAAMECIPAPARAALPTFRDLDGVLAVPHLTFARSTVPRGFRALYRPAGNLGGNVFGPVA